MDEPSLLNFTKKMIAEEVFSCAICKNLLTFPVMIVKNVGNVCNSCYETHNVEKDWLCVQNNNFPIIFKELKFPCKFISKGCKAEILYPELEYHYKRCQFRTTSCLMQTTDGCQWQGKFLDVAKHCMEEHSTYVTKSDNDTFSFDVNVIQLTNVIRLLKNKSNTYILEISKILDKKCESLLHVIRDLNSSSPNMEFVIKYAGKNGHHKRKCALYNKNDQEYGAKIYLLSLLEIAENNGNVCISLKPYKEKISETKLYDEVVKQLECSICRDTMRLPIEQCIIGHPICSVCRPKLSECPTCREEWGNARNFALEDLSASVLYPCAYTHCGCDVKSPGTIIEKHEAVCTFKTYECPIESCKFTGNFCAAKNHFQTNHPDSLIETTLYKTSFAVSNNNSGSVRYLFEYSNIYKFSFNRTKDACNWQVEILNTYDHNKKYFYFITVNDPHIKQRKVVKSNLCSEDELISFTNSELALFKNPSNNDLVEYTFELTEVLAS